MAKKVRVGVLFGGRSGEHEVSLLSAASVLQNIDKKKYEIVPIGITKDGRWVTSGHAEQLLRGEHKDSERTRALAIPITPSPPPCSPKANQSRPPGAFIR